MSLYCGGLVGAAPVSASWLDIAMDGQFAHPLWSKGGRNVAPSSRDLRPQNRPAHSAGAGKRPYAKPELRDLGGVQELTMSGTSGTSYDGGGSYPNLYTTTPA